MGDHSRQQPVRKNQKFRRKTAGDVLAGLVHHTGVQIVALVLVGSVALGSFSAYFGHNTEGVVQSIGSQSSNSQSGSGWGDASGSVQRKTASSQTAPRRRTKLTLSQAKKLAFSVSEKAENLKEKLEKAEQEYANKVKAVEIKRNYISTWHWKFLLSIELPRDPTLDEIYDFAYGPAEKLEAVRQAKNNLADFKISLENDVTNLYIDIYKSRERIEFDQERLLLAQDALARTEALAATGEKTEDDVKAAKQTVTNLESSITSTERAANASAKKLAKLLDLVSNYGTSSPDPTLEGYELVNPYQTQVLKKLSRKDLPYLKSYTLEHDNEVFEARGAKSLAYVAITSYWNAIAQQMAWSDMSILAPYYNRIVSGQQVNKRELKAKYKQFLKAIDSYWEGGFSIGFWPILFRLKYIWFKGKRDGSWYMSDNPECLLDASLEYMSAYKECVETEDGKRDEVEDAYNTYIGIKNALVLVQEQRDDLKGEYENAKVLYRIGELTAEEYNTILDDYQNIQTQEMDSLTSFSQQVSSLNRLTCGAIERLMSGDSVENENGSQMVVANEVDGATYYITPKYEQLAFDIGICIPDDFEVQVTDFELWCDNVQVGQRVAKDKVITHLMTATADVKKTVIRLYNGTEFVSDCEIDPGILQGPLKITQFSARTEEKGIGSYEIQENEGQNTVTLKIIPDADSTDNIGSFVLFDANGVAINSKDKKAVNTGVKYLPALVKSLGSVTAKLYDQDGNYLYDATFDVANKKLVRKAAEGE